MTKHKVTIYLEHDTKKPIRQTLKTSGFRGIVFAGKIAKWIGQGYRLVNVEGDPDDPIYQRIKGFMDQYEKTGKVVVEAKDTYQFASKMTGAKAEEIQKKVDKTLKKWKKRFKGVSLNE